MSAAVAAVLASLIEAANPKELSFIVTDAELDARLSDDPATQRQVLRDLIGTEIVPLLNRLQGVPYSFTQAKLAKLQSDSASVAWTKPACNTLPNSTPLFMEHKLRRDPPTRTSSALDTSVATRILWDYANDPGHSWSFPTTASEARTQYLELIALKGFFLRIMAASDAAREASVPLADALAIYRREGDLVMPLPVSHFADWVMNRLVVKDLANRLPPIERAFAVNFDKWAVELKDSLKHGLWKQKTPTLIVTATDVDDALVTSFFNWCILIVGFDYMSNNVTTLGDYYTFSHMLRDKNAIAGSSVVARQARFTALMATLRIGPLDQMFVMAPSDPVALVSHILAEALLFMKLAGTADVNGPFIKPPAALMYLAHHTSDTRHYTEPKKDKFSWIVASAAVALAGKAAAPPYCPAAHAKVRTLGLPARLPDFPARSKESPDAHAAVATTIKNGLTPGEMDQLAQFILRAEAADWGAFKIHRANIANYARVRAYYEVVAAP